MPYYGTYFCEEELFHKVVIVFGSLNLKLINYTKRPFRTLFLYSKTNLNILIMNKHLRNQTISTMQILQVTFIKKILVICNCPSLYRTD